MRDCRFLRNQQGSYLGEIQNTLIEEGSQFVEEVRVGTDSFAVRALAILLGVVSLTIF